MRKFMGEHIPGVFAQVSSASGVQNCTPCVVPENKHRRTVKMERISCFLALEGGGGGDKNHTPDIAVHPHTTKSLSGPWLGNIEGATASSTERLQK